MDTTREIKLKVPRFLSEIEKLEIASSIILMNEGIESVHIVDDINEHQDIHLYFGGEMDFEQLN